MGDMDGMMGDSDMPEFDERSLALMIEHRTSANADAQTEEITEMGGLLQAAS